MKSMESWIVKQGLSGSSVSSLLSGFAERLVAEGVPLVRAYLAMPTVNPTIRVYNHVWTRSTGAAGGGLSHESDRKVFETSPIAYMLRMGLGAKHWRFDEAGTEQFGAFDDVRRQGGRDYLARLIRFENESAPDLQGIAASFSADREGGFSASEIAQIDAVLPLLALAAYRIALFDVTVTLLDTYVGFSAGRRALRGEIRRGVGTTLTAVLLFADLRGFTALADTAGEQLIARLDQHLEAMAEPVAEHGGEVLKFLGDGLLAAFPVTKDRPQAAACADAVRAAQAALRRNDAVNRHLSNETPLSLDIALNAGDVFYGNIGAAGRLDFTVIGPTVNEVSRMEALCRVLGCAIVMSADVAAASPLRTRTLGRHTLRGVGTERELFTLDA